MTLNQKDQELISLYKKGANEEPSQVLNQTILDYSKVSRARNIRWWPYLSIAASIGLVALLAPWQWQEQELPQADFTDELQLMGVPMQSEEAVEMKKATEVERDLRAKSSLEIAPEPGSFIVVEKLLDEGKKEEALSELKEILKNNPELEDQLPEQLQKLLTE